MGKRSATCACVLAGALLTACLDFAPLPYEAPPAVLADASIPDAGSADANTAACGECLATKGCASKYAACEANPKCASFAACLTQASCWSSSLTDLSHLQPCLSKCAVSVGFYSQTDPAVIVFSPLVVCAQDPDGCGAACDPGANGNP